MVKSISRSIGAFFFRPRASLVELMVSSLIHELEGLCKLEFVTCFSSLLLNIQTFLRHYTFLFLLYINFPSELDFHRAFK